MRSPSFGPTARTALVLARRIFADGRTRAYAWGRSAAREDVAAAAEALIAMSGQFEQRRLARPAYQRGVLDAFAGLDTRAARARLARARRRPARLRRADPRRGRGRAAARGAAAARRGHGRARGRPGGRAAGRARAASPPRGARARRRRRRERARPRGRRRRDRPRRGRRARRRARSSGSRRSSRAPARRCARRSCSCARPRPTCAPSSRRSRRSPGGSSSSRPSSSAFSDLKRRHRAQTYAELLERGEEARRELAALAEGHDPVRAAAEAVAAAEAEVDRLHAELRAGRRAAAEPFAAAVAAELQAIGLGDGEFQVVLGEREPGASGADDVAFLIRPNAGLPFGPVAETASGGELSRVALAIAAVAGGETMVFDEIDAGIGGTTAHAVAETLRRLAERAQVLTITHLPQIATRRRPALRASRRSPATRPTRGSSRSTTRSAATSSSGCSAGRTSSPRSTAVRVSERSARAARPARGRLGVPRRALPPVRLVARDHRRRARPARLRTRGALEGARDQAQHLHGSPKRRDDAAGARDRPLRAVELPRARAEARRRGPPPGDGR